MRIIPNQLTLQKFNAMTLAELKQNFSEQLSSLYDQDEINSILSIYLEDKFVLSSNVETTLVNDAELLHDINELAKGKPVQHITKKAFFYDNFFLVNEHTLIPRPETEELVELIRTDFDNNLPLNIIDLGTGSGCIPISLSKLFHNAKISALDISEEALKVAKENADNLDVKINFYHENLLENIELNQKFDVIISNPPYIRNLEKSEMHHNVLDFEPHSALFVEDDDALIFYERIIDFAQKHLAQNGTIYCEINQYLGNETKDLFEKFYPNTSLIKDISGNYRIIKASVI